MRPRPVIDVDGIPGLDVELAMRVSRVHRSAAAVGIGGKKRNETKSQRKRDEEVEEREKEDRREMRAREGNRTRGRVEMSTPVRV